jgi:hypothetical protein
MDASCVLVCSCTSCGQTSVLLQCTQVARICAWLALSTPLGVWILIYRIAPVLIRFRTEAQAATQLRSLNVFTVVAVFHCLSRKTSVIDTNTYLLGVFGFCALRVLLTAWILLPSYAVRPLCRLLAVAFAMLGMLVFCVWVRFFDLLSSSALRVVV